MTWSGRQIPGRRANRTRGEKSRLSGEPRAREGREIVRCVGAGVNRPAAAVVGWPNLPGAAAAAPGGGGDENAQNFAGKSSGPEAAMTFT